MGHLFLFARTKKVSGKRYNNMPRTFSESDFITSAKPRVFSDDDFVESSKTDRIGAFGYIKETGKKMASAFPEGWRDNQQLMVDGDAVFGLRSKEEADKAFEESKKMPRTESRDKFQEAFVDAARMAGQMGESQTRAVTVGSGVGLAAGAATLGAAALPGFWAGYRIQVLIDSIRMGAGDVYRQARESGIDHDTAKVVAMIGSIPYAYVEYAQLRGFLPKGNTVQRGLVRRIFAALGKSGIEVVKQSGEESMQKAISEASTIVGKAIEGDLPTLTSVSDSAKAAWDEFFGTLGPMAVMRLIPGAKDIHTAVKYSDGPTIANAQKWANENPAMARWLVKTPDPTSRKAAEIAGLPRMNKEGRTAFAEALKQATIPAEPRKPARAITPQPAPEAPALEAAEAGPAPISADAAQAANPGRFIVADEAGNVAPGSPENGFATEAEALSFMGETPAQDQVLPPPVDDLKRVAEESDAEIKARTEGQPPIAEENAKAARADAQEDLARIEEERKAQDAIQEPSAAELDVGKPPEDGKKVGEALTARPVAEEGRTEGVAKKPKVKKKVTAKKVKPEPAAPEAKAEPAAPAEKAPELMSPEEVAVQTGIDLGISTDRMGATRTGEQALAIQDALNERRPVNAASYDRLRASEIPVRDLPDGYIREGDRYVFKGKEKPATKVGQKLTQPPLIPENEGGFKLTGEKGVDGERIMREQEEAERKKAEFESRQQDLIDNEGQVVTIKKNDLADREMELKDVLQAFKNKKATEAEVKKARAAVKSAKKAVADAEKAAKKEARPEPKPKKVGRRDKVDEEVDQARQVLVGRVIMPKKGEWFHEEAQRIPLRFRAKKGSKRGIAIGQALIEANQFLQGRELQSEDELIEFLQGEQMTVAQAQRDERKYYSEMAEKDAYEFMLGHLRSDDFDQPNAEFDAAAKEFPEAYDAARKEYQREFEEAAKEFRGAEEFNPPSVGMGAALAVRMKPAKPLKKGEKDIMGDVTPGTSPSHAYTDKMRTVMGMEDRAPTVEKSDESLIEDAGKALVDSNGMAGRELTAKMENDPSYVPTDVEEMLLVYEMNRLQALRNNAYENTNTGKGTLAEAEMAQAALESVYRLVERGGTAAGRALRARQILLADDFSIINLERTFSAIKRSKLGQEKSILSEERRAWIKMMSEKQAKLKKEFEDALAAKERELQSAKAEIEEKDSDAKARNSAEIELNKVIEDIRRIEAERDAALQELQAVKNSYDGLRDLFKRAAEGKGRNRIFTDERMKAIRDRAANARAKLREMQSQVGAGIDPTRIIYLAEIAAEYISSGLAYTESMIREFGESIRPHLPEIEKKALENLKQAAIEDARDESAFNLDRQENAAKKARRSGVTIRQMFRDQVEAGVFDLDTIVENVRKIIQKNGPTDGLSGDPSAREIMDRFSGYGKPLMPSRNPVEVALARLRTKSQKLSQLDDLMKRIMPKKSGRQRLESTAEERELARRVRVLMKELGFSTRTSEAQMKSALDAAKTRLRNSIRDIELALESGKRIERPKGGVEYDAEGKALKAKLDALRADYDKAFGPVPMTDEQRLEIALRAAEKNVEMWQERVEKARRGEIAGSKKISSVWSPEIAEAKKRAAEARAELKRIEDALNPPLTEAQKELKRAMDRTINLIRKGEARIKAKDFGPRPYKKPINLQDHPDLLARKMEWERVKMEIKAGQAQAEFDAMTGSERARFLFLKVWDITRNFKGSMDMSALGRQGWFYMFTHPVQWAMAFRSAKAFTATEAERQQQALFGREGYKSGVYDAAKLALNKTDGSGNFTSAEDNFRLDLSRKIAILGLGIDASNRLYATAINDMRAGFLDLLLSNSEMGREIMKNPRRLNEKQRQFLLDLGEGVNALTGRGKLSGAETWARYGWAPRFVKSTFDVLSLRPIRAAKTTEAKILFAKEYARLAISLGAVYAIAAAFGGDDDDNGRPAVEWDTRSSNFGAIRLWGNYYWNPIAVVKPQLVFLARLLSGQMKVGQKIVNLRDMYLPFATEEERAEDVTYGGGMSKVISRFLQSKAHPTVGVLLSLFTGKTFSGRDATPARMLVDSLAPLTPEQSIETFSTTDPATATAMTLMEGLGLGVNADYNDYRVMEYQAESKEKFQERLEGMDLDRIKDIYLASRPEDQAKLKPLMELKLGHLMWSASDAESPKFDKEAFDREVRRLRNNGPDTDDIRDIARENLAARADKRNASLLKKRAQAIRELKGISEDEAIEFVKRYVASKGDKTIRSINGKLTPYGKRIRELRKIYAESNANNF